MATHRGHPSQPPPNPFGEYLYECMRHQELTYKALSRMLQDEGYDGNLPKVRRLFYNVKTTVRWVDADTLIRILDADRVKFFSHAREVKVIFEWHPDINMIRIPKVKLDWVEHTAEGLEYLLRQGGNRAYVLQQAKRYYRDLRMEEGLSQQSEPVMRLLLRFGEIIEQTLVSMYPWRKERTEATEGIFRRVNKDIFQTPGGQLFADEHMQFLSRWAVLHRENDQRQLSQQAFDMGMETLYSRVTNPITKFAFRCQSLHAESISGNPMWESHINEARKAIDLEIRRKRSAKIEGKEIERDDLTEIIEDIYYYFKAVGFKRLAWYLRTNPDRSRINTRKIYLMNAYDNFRQLNESSQRHIRKFDDSTLRLTAHRISNYYGPSVSDQQLDLLLRISEMEALVWSDPKRVLRQCRQLEAETQQYYPSATTKVLDVRKFARLLEEHEEMQYIKT